MSLFYSEEKIEGGPLWKVVGLSDAGLDGVKVCIHESSEYGKIMYIETWPIEYLLQEYNSDSLKIIFIKEVENCIEKNFMGKLDSFR